MTCGAVRPIYSIAQPYQTFRYTRSGAISSDQHSHLQIVRVSLDFFNRSNASKTPSAGTVNELPVDVRDWMSEEVFSVLIRSDGQVAER